MKTNLAAAVCFILLSVTGHAADLQPFPRPWEMIGVGRSQYEAGLDPLAGFAKPAGYIRSKVKSVELPGVLAQIMLASRYAGRHLKYSASLKYSGVKRQVGLWMWALDSKRRVVASEFMDDRILKGSSDWNHHEIVLKIPKNAITIVFGVRLWGEGKAWVNDMAIETENGPVGDVQLL